MMRDGFFRSAATAALLACVFNAAACGAGGRQVERSAARRLLGGGPKVAESRTVFEKDMWRDLTTRVTRLPAPRTVFRYMSAEEARLVRSRGIPAGKHFTATGGPGRPMSGTRAAQRYGLRAIPSHRPSVQLPAGTRVKMNKVLGGAPGVGELRVMDSVKAGQVRSPVRLQR